MLKCIDLFAGIGAWELAIELVNPISQIKFQTIEFVEINPQAQKVLRSHFPDIPIHPDIRNYEAIANKADVYFVSSSWILPKICNASLLGVDLVWELNDGKN